MAIDKSTKIKWGLAVVMVGLSAFVVNYLAKQVRMLVRTKFAMSGIAINKITFKEINFSLWWKVTNNSDISFTISNQVYDVYLNGKLAKRVGNKPDVKISPHSVGKIPTNVVLDYKELVKIGLDNIGDLLDKDKRNKIQLEVVGTFTLKTSVFTLKDFPFEFKDTFGNIANY